MAATLTSSTLTATSICDGQAKDSNYVIQTLLGDTVVIAPKFLKELNMLPESKLNSTEALVERVMGQYCGVDMLLQDHLTNDICRGAFTRNLGKLTDRPMEDAF